MRWRGSYKTSDIKTINFESLIFPTKVYIRLNPEFDDTDTSGLDQYEWDDVKKRMDVTEYVINVGNVSFEGENEIFSNTSGNSSVTIDVINLFAPNFNNLHSVHVQSVSVRL